MHKLYADEIARFAQENQAGLPDGRWVAARPVPYWGLVWRLKRAWDVFWLKADAVYWYGQ
jgi:hypothetical protein